VPCALSGGFFGSSHVDPREARQTSISPATVFCS
jgi:hypothetical protein